MSVRRRQHRNTNGTLVETWTVDVDFEGPDGAHRRVRKVSPVQTRRGAEEYERQVRQALLDGSYDRPASGAPTLEDFAPRWIEGYCRANRQKHSSIVSKESILEHHLLPLLGQKRLDQITTADVQVLKGRLQDRSPKTVNNVLTVLSKLLKVAADWGSRGGGIDSVPVQIHLLRVAPPTMPFYEEEVLQQLAEAAAKVGPRVELLVLLGADAGLRIGEIAALEWADIDLRRGQLEVRRQVWRGVVGPTKGGRPRRLPLTARLTAALQAHRHLRGPRVLYREAVDTAGAPKPLTQKTAQVWMQAAQRRAGMTEDGRVHVLRHTFCSRLAMAGVPAKAIQELAGHVNITTTQRYMHLAPGGRDQAIQALDALQQSGTLAAPPEAEKTGGP